MEKSFLPTTIESQRIFLKKHNIDLAELMFSFVDRDRQRLRQFLPWVDGTKSVQDEINFIEMTHDLWEKSELFDFGIYRQSDGQYMGNIGVHSIAWDNDRCEFGYWILGDFEGQGYISEAVLALEKVCFELGFHRIEIRCSSKNQRSAQVPVRCGYRLEGTLLQDSIELGKYRETLIFGKLKNQQVSVTRAIVGLEFVYLFTPDLGASKKWYESVLGIKPTLELENFVEFRPGGSSGLCLHPADTKSPLTTGGSVGYWRVTHFQDTIEHFKSHGAKVYRGPLDIGNGESICQMLDPIGNVIRFVGT